MAGDDLAALGLEIRGEAAEWLDGLLDGWSIPGAWAAAEPIAELVMLERALASLAGQVAELEELEAALTAGFPGTPSPAPPVDGPAGETEDAEPRAGRRSRGPGDAHGSPAHVSPGSGEAGRGDANPSLARPIALPLSAPLERDPAGTGSPRADRGTSVDPSSRGGIRGIGDLASLAGSAGLDLPEPNEGTDHDLSRSGDDRAASGRRGWDDAAPTRGTSAPDSDAGRRRQAAWDDADRSTADAGSTRTWDDPSHPVARDRGSATASAPAPIRLPRRDLAGSSDPATSSARDTSIGAAGESRGDIDDPEARNERRWNDLPRSLAGLARGDALTLGLLEPGAIALPFLSMPGQSEEGDSAENTPADRAGDQRASREGEAIDRRATTSPAPRPRGAATGQAWTADASGGADPTAWLDELGADADAMASPGLARFAARRVRTAAEILSALGPGALTVDAAPRLEGSAEWPTVAPEPAERPTPEPSAASDPRPRAADDEAPVAIVRSVEPAPRDAFPEPPGWPDLDVQDLMDALAREIMHEYRRYYGA